MANGIFTRLLTGAALACAMATPALAQSADYQNVFDQALGTEKRAPRDYAATYNVSSPMLQRVAQLAEGSQGRIGVAAIDLSSGQEVGILSDQRFPMASTSKVAVAATFLEGVDQGKWSLDSRFPLMVPVASKAFSTEVAPVRAGDHMTARELINIMISRSSNPATDALLKVVGGPKAVNDWARRAGLTDFTLSRDIATLVRDDGEINPASSIDIRDSASPRAMIQLLQGLHQGQWLSQSSRNVLLGAMERTVTGTRRIPAMMPAGVKVAHKTGSLNNTSSDIGIITTPDGRKIALAIYVTGQGTRLNREAKIASIARAVHDGFVEQEARQWTSARY